MPAKPDKPSCPWVAIRADDFEAICRDCGAEVVTSWVCLNLKALKAGSSTLRLPGRALAYDAGLSRKTAIRHLGLLAKAAFIRLEHCRGPGGDEANTIILLRGAYAYPWGDSTHLVCSASGTSTTHLLQESQSTEIQERQETTTARTRKPAFSEPSLTEIQAFAAEIGSPVDPEHFMLKNRAAGWTLKDGRPIRDWKAVFRTWDRQERQNPRPRRTPAPPRADEPETPVHNWG